MHPKKFVATDHDIDHSQIDEDALYVLRKLGQSGYKAYLVGGSVRDLLAQRPPKDFDISTSASPEEIKTVFRRRCILIGKRFRLAHIRFGHKVIEVATFRAGENDSDLIVRDNTWGSEEEDVNRRDFTINGLFYDPFHHTVIDYVGGWDDIHSKIIRSIGDPIVRFKQDPVRMIRLLKFRARFGFEIESETKKALIQCRNEITKSAPARIFEEIMKMLESGASAPFLHLMSTSGILPLLIPELQTFLTEPEGKKVYELLDIVDQINQNEHYPLNRGLLISCLLYPMVKKKIQDEFLDQDLHPHLGDIMSTTTSLIKSTLIQSFTHFPKRISAITAQIITTQFRMTPLSGKRHYKHKFMRTKEFPLALKFLQIRALANKDLISSYRAWKNVYRQHLHHGPSKTKHPPPTNVK